MVNSLWFKWKKLRLPWRKSFLVGQDLVGNTFWEFKDVMNAARMRRIVRFDPKTHFSDVQVTPQWHQWLRHVREHPPSIQEQQQDLVRQAQMKELARLADERWASKPSFLDKPNTQPAPPQVNDVPAAPKEQASVSPEATLDPKPASTEKAPKENPWKNASNANPGAEWQPEAWSPSSKR
ncbi:hypothetical protein N7541_007513 [Penicillium brevicompactum]|uniref:NADH dehydrogenase [ubiquinone] 1 alpha subcomplex subunit n=1 Tax=Penicillium brevicompactum TaxID=5074 RepID=A0A9W9QXA1_PENBR|nr:hypothetical protein N7541_007513 [Penicillium brevicompactum]